MYGLHVADLTAAAAAVLRYSDSPSAGHIARICLTYAVEPGDATLTEVMHREGWSPESIMLVIVGNVPAPDRFAEAFEGWRTNWNARKHAVMGDLRELAAAGGRVLIPGHSDWPVQVDDLIEPPIALYARGEAASGIGLGALATLFSSSMVTMTGARAATGYGEHVAIEMTSKLVDRGVTIVSGAAYGIDGTAHRAAMSAGGKTIAVLASGLRQAYPIGHANLIDRIAKHGLLISEVPWSFTPTKSRFIQRNRLMGALSNATVIVEAGARSGSTSTAHVAQLIGRPAGAVPGPLTSAASAGCHNLIREGVATLVTSADDVWALIGGEVTA